MLKSSFMRYTVSQIFFPTNHHSIISSAKTGTAKLPTKLMAKKNGEIPFCHSKKLALLATQKIELLFWPSVLFCILF
jgi:hypothetical protein